MLAYCSYKSTLLLITVQTAYEVKPFLFYKRFDVLTAVVTKSSIIWKIMTCRLLKMNQDFGGIFCLYLQDRRLSQVRNQHEACNEQTELCWLPASCWRFGGTGHQHNLQEKTLSAHWRGGWRYPEPVWATWKVEKSCPYRDSNFDPSAVKPAESLYWLRCVP